MQNFNNLLEFIAQWIVGVLFYTAASGCRASGR